MAFLSKKDILHAYKTLSEMREDPTAQGATQNVSAIRHFVALDHFYYTTGKDCDTRDKSDKLTYQKYVGEVCEVCDGLYTTNFYYPLKSHNGDFNVGSNFYSAGQVRLSLSNKSHEFPYPQRGNAPLMYIKNGVLIRDVTLYKNLSSYLETTSFKIAFAIWMLRDISLDDYKGNGISYIRNALSKLFTIELVNELVPNSTGSKEDLKSYSLINSNRKANISAEDIKDILGIEDDINKEEHDAKAILSKEQLSQKVREGFIRFWNIIDQHGAEIENKYIPIFEDTIDKYLQKLDCGYSDVFQIIDVAQYESIINQLINKFPELSSLKKGHSKPEFKYEVWTTNRHYYNYLEILANSKFFGNLNQQEKRRIEVVSKNIADDHRKYLRAMRTKPFLLLAGISGTGKSRIVKEFAYKSCPAIGNLREDNTSPGNYCLIEVKPNWHDSTELLGYESFIGSKHYVVTTFIKFLVKAMLYPDVPFFVCLDEMNLAPVEQYFAEFLSILESRKLDNGRITTEALIPASIFTTYGDSLKSDLFNLKIESKTTEEDTKTKIYYLEANERQEEIFNLLKEKGLRIPDNLIVIGTVNMDETTHQFSRKVIDRAMTIEMNIGNGTGPFESFFYDYRELSYQDPPLPKDLFIAPFPQANAVLDVFSSETLDFLKREVPERLSELNSSLEGTPFKIAYRVENELLLYFYAIKKDSPETEADSAILSRALDGIMMMKVLPRVEGDEDLLSKPLKELENYTSLNGLNESENKVKEMRERLERGHFTSFWP